MCIDNDNDIMKANEMTIVKYYIVKIKVLLMCNVY